MAYYIVTYRLPLSSACTLSPYQSLYPLSYPGPLQQVIRYYWHVKGKAVPLQARRGPQGSRKLRFPDFVTTAQGGGTLSAVRTGRFTPRKYSWYSFLLEAGSTPGQ